MRTPKNKAGVRRQEQARRCCPWKRQTFWTLLTPVIKFCTFRFNVFNLVSEGNRKNKELVNFAGSAARTCCFCYSMLCCCIFHNYGCKIEKFSTLFNYLNVVSLLKAINYDIYTCSDTTEESSAPKQDLHGTCNAATRSTSSK